MRLVRLIPSLPSAARAALLLLPLAVAAPAFAADTASAAPTMTDNPLLRPSDLPFGYPHFDLIKDEHFAPAYEAGMAEETREVDAIANASAAPTFDNTIVALERSGRTLDRVDRIFSALNGANTNPRLQAVERDLAPKLAAHEDSIHLNAKLFARIQAVYDQRAQLDLDPESLRLVERTYKDFVRAGAKLSDADKARLQQLNTELAELQTTFSQNVLKEKNASSIVVDSRDELTGLSPAEFTATEAAAKDDGQSGRYVIRLMNTTQQPSLASLENRALRQRIMAASLARGSHGGEFDNRATVARLVRLRAERAQLLGYPTHAAYQLEEQTAHDVGTVNKLLADLAQPAVANARREAADIQQIIDQEKGGFQVTAADWDFYAEKVRAARYAFDESKLKPYFELNRVLTDGVFYAATQLYGITFKERKDLPVYHPDVRVWEVHDTDGSLLAFFIGDYYARPSKRGGAWMNAYVAQSTLLGTQPVVANHLNIPKPADGQPTLLTFDEVTTAFHEFGHALHGMFSRVKYPRFAGTQVPRDFVEYPSQVNEMWATWPEVLKNYARHYQTGEPMPQELVDKVLAAQKFNQGYATTEYLAASILDQAWHQIKPEQAPAADGVLAFEATALKNAGVDFAPVPPRYRSTYFSHIFENGYSAGYYSYIWAEVLDADSVEWFKQHGGLKRENGDHFRAALLSRGGSKDALKLFHDFTGRDPYVEPLLKRRGLDQPPATE